MLCWSLQDVSGGKPVAVEAGDTEQRLWGMEIDVAAAAAEVRGIGKADEGKSIDEFLGGIGLGAVSEQLKDLRLGGGPGVVSGVDRTALHLFLALLRVGIFCVKVLRVCAVGEFCVHSVRVVEGRTKWCVPLAVLTVDDYEAWCQASDSCGWLWGCVCWRWCPRGH